MPFVAVLFARWAQAEAAAEALDGTAALTGGQGRPLVVHFANPRKPPPGQMAEPGLAPKKLFVGQASITKAPDQRIASAWALLEELAGVRGGITKYRLWN